MKNKIFSKGLYVETLRQLRLSGIIALVVCFFGAFLTPLFRLMSYLSAETNEIRENMLTVVDYEYFLPFLMVLAVIGPLFAFLIFSQFNRRVASDFYHSLPYTRLCQFNSYVAGIVTWIAIIGVFYVGVSIATHACMPFLYIISFAGCFDYILTVVAITLILTFGVICAMTLTGTPLANLVTAAIIIAGPRAALSMITLVIGELAPVLSISGGFLDLNFNVLFGLFSYDSDPFVKNITQDIYTICLSVVYLILAAVFFIVRRSETAGQTAGTTKLQDAIRIAVAFAISGIGTCVGITDGEIELVIVMYVIALIAYFAFELITKKNFKALARTVPGLGILVALNLAVVGICFGGAAYIHSYTPDAEDIEGFYLNNESYYTYYSEISFAEYAATFTDDVLITDEDAVEIIAESLANTVEESKAGRFYHAIYNEKGEIERYQQKNVTIVDKNGSKKHRTIWILESDVLKISKNLEENESYRDIYMNLPEALERTVRIGNSWMGVSDIDEEKALELYNSLREEVKNLDFVDWYQSVNSYGYYAENPSSMQIYLTTKEDGTELMLNVESSVTPKTHLKILEMLNGDAVKEAEELKQIFDTYISVSDEESAGKYYYVTVMGYSEEYGGAWNITMSSGWGEDMVTDYLDYNAYMIDKIVEAANSEKAVTSDEYIWIEVTEEIYDEYGNYEYETTRFTVPYPDDISLNTNYVGNIYYAEAVLVD